MIIQKVLHQSLILVQHVSRSSVVVVVAVAVAVAAAAAVTVVLE